jgi:nucleoid-associated protein YgaU
MLGRPEAAIVDAAIWIAIAAAVYAVGTLVRAKPAGSAMTAAVLALGATVGGVASAGSPHPGPPALPSLGWGAQARHSTAARDVVVRPGDCLWAITARELRDPTAARVSDRWPGWWRTNRRVIGPDPNVIHPGQRLRRPDPTPRSH